MAALLHGLGRFAFRRRRTVALVRVALLVFAGVAASQSAGPPDDFEARDTTTTVVPDSRPGNPRTEALVEDIHDRADELRERTGAVVYVSGATAVDIGFSRVTDAALVPYPALVVGLLPSSCRRWSSTRCSSRSRRRSASCCRYRRRWARSSRSSSGPA